MPASGIIQSLWVAGDLPLMQQMSVASFLAQGHEYHLYTYDPSLRAPTGTVVRYGSEILPNARVFRDKNGYAAFSDCFRYRLLLLRGGWWVDTDVVCLRRFDFDSSYVFSSEHHPDRGEGKVPNTGVIRAPAGAPVIEYADGVCAAKDTSSIQWAELGPALMNDAIRRFSLDAQVMPPEAFCPIPWFGFRDVLDPSLPIRFREETYAVHLWNAIWERHGLDTNAAYHPCCAYEAWKREFLTRDCCSPR
jgi:hypothetical protein